jgi:mono/diheme cytochrome c family protein
MTMRKIFAVFVLVLGLFLVFGSYSAMTQTPLSGEALVNQRCVQCHALAVVDRAKSTKDAAEWERTIDRKIAMRPGLLNEAERTAVLEYLIQK